MARSTKQDGNRQRGQAMVEYALILVLVVLAVMSILSLVGPTVENAFANVISQIQCGVEGHYTCDANGCYCEDAPWELGNKYYPEVCTCNSNGTCEPALNEFYLCCSDCSPPPPPDTCGDGTCQPGEYPSCRLDCDDGCGGGFANGHSWSSPNAQYDGGGSRISDGMCSGTENETNCPEECTGVCNQDGVCSGDETFSNCPRVELPGGGDDPNGGDCGCIVNEVGCEPSKGENPVTCPRIYVEGERIGDCGCVENNVCEPKFGENEVNCPADCGAGGMPQCSDIVIEDKDFSFGPGGNRNGVQITVKNGLPSPVYIARVVVDWPTDKSIADLGPDVITLGASANEIWGTRADGTHDTTAPTDTETDDASEWLDNSDDVRIAAASGTRELRVGFAPDVDFPNDAADYLLEDFDITVYFTNHCVISTTGEDLTPEEPPPAQCEQFSVDPVAVANATETETTIRNTSGQTVEITRIDFAWTKLDGSMANDYLKLENKYLWGQAGGTKDSEPSTDTGSTDSGEWLASGVSPIVPAGGALRLYNGFVDAPNIQTGSNASDYQYTVTLSNGCVLQTENLAPDTYIYIEDLDFDESGSWNLHSQAALSACTSKRGLSTDEGTSLAGAFDLNRTGAYRIMVHAKNRGDDCDTFLYSIDGDPKETLDIGADWDWYTLPTQIFDTAGTHTIEFWAGDTGGGTCGEGGADLDVVYITNDMALEPTLQHCQATEPIWMEAEDGQLDGPATIIGGEDYSGCAYVTVPDMAGDYDGNGWVDLDFQTYAPGEYMVWGRVWGPDGGANTVWISMDNGYEFQWHTPHPTHGHTYRGSRSDVIKWDPAYHDDWNINDGVPEQDPIAWDLNPGPHTLRIRPSEDGTYIDALVVVLMQDGSPAFTPTEDDVVCEGEIPGEDNELVCGADPVTGMINDVNTGKEWQFEVLQDMVVTLTMRRTAGDVDPYLELIAPNGDVLVEDDDHGQLPDDPATPEDESYYTRYDAELSYRLEEPGVYRVLARRDDNDAGGYNLALECTPLVYAPVTCGEVIGDNDPTGDLAEITEASWFDMWEFAASQETELTVAMTRVSGNVDPYLYLMDSEGNILEQDDDDGPSNNALLEYTVDPGIYTIMATRYQQAAGSTTGGYTLSIGCGAQQFIECNETVEGRISNIDNYDYWTFSATAGDVISVTMNKDPSTPALDPYLEIYDQAGFLDTCHDYNNDCEDDDYGIGNNASLTFYIPEDGQYTIKATHYGSTEGDYDLTMTCHEPVEIACGQTVTGSLDNLDFIDRYVFDANDGDRVYIRQEVTSGDLDSKIYLRYPWDDPSEPYKVRDSDYRQPDSDDGVSHALIYDDSHYGRELNKTGTWEIWASRYVDSTSYNPGNDFGSTDNTGTYELTFMCDWDYDLTCSDYSFGNIYFNDDNVSADFTANSQTLFPAYITEITYYVPWRESDPDQKINYFYVRDPSYDNRLWNYDDISPESGTSPPDSVITLGFGDSYPENRRIEDNDNRALPPDTSTALNMDYDNLPSTEDWSLPYKHRIAMTISDPDGSTTCELDTYTGQCGGETPAVCDYFENPENCPADCPDVCGDGLCTGSETISTCDLDCDDDCGGDMLCTGGEDYNNCPTECSYSYRTNAHYTVETGPDSNGNMWEPENGFTGKDSSSEYGNEITGTDDDFLFQSYLWGNDPGVYWDKDVPNGSYTVRLYFAELYYSSAGNRDFDISIEDTTVEDHFDPYTAAGGQNKAVILSFNVNVSDDQINIHLDPHSGNATINAIEIIGQPSTCGATPVQCDPGENADNCPGDCPDTCGDGYCSSTETADSSQTSKTLCEEDCSVCGDSLCTGSETESNCPEDCVTSVCGDGTCTSGQEDKDSCPADCTPPSLNCDVLATGEITDADALDYYTFSGTAGKRVSITMYVNPYDGSLDPFVELYDNSLTLLTSDDDSRGGHTGLNAQIRDYVLPSTGIYYIRATRPSGNTTTGEYSLAVECLNESPTVMSCGTAETGYIDSSNWYDNYSFFGTAGDNITVTMDRTSGGLDTWITLRDADMKYIDHNDDNPDQTHSELSYTLPSTGTYYITASRWRQFATSGGTSGDYSLEVTGCSKPTVVIRAEVEDGSIDDQGRLTTTYDENASGCYYLEALSDNGDRDDGGGPYMGQSTVTVDIPFEDDYVVWGYISGPGGGSDSYWVSVDGGDPYSNQWFMTTTNGPFAWDRVMDQQSGTDPVVFHLTPGAHTFTFRVREDGSKIDVIDVTNDTGASISHDAFTCSGFDAIRVNAGGSTYTDTGGNAWAADTGFSGGNTYTTSNGIAGTDDDTIYQSEHYGDMTWSGNVPNGDYTVKLHFAEVYHNSPGSREMNVSIEGTQVLSGFDVYDAAGGKDIAYLAYFNTTVNDGTLSIAFDTVVDNAKISGIEVLSGHSPFVCGDGSCSGTYEDVYTCPTDCSTGGSSRTPGEIVLYEFDEGSGTVINDTSGYGSPLNLSIESSGDTDWIASGLRVNSSADRDTRITTGGAATKLINAITASNAITIEAWIKPALSSQSGPARVVSLSQDGTNRNFTLGQDGGKYQIRLRTTSTGSNGSSPYTATSSNLAATSLQHVVYTRDSGGTVKIYINGSQVSASQSTISGTMSGSWNTGYRLLLGNEYDTSTSDRFWKGEMYLVAVYDKALTASEVTDNYNAGANP